MQLVFLIIAICVFIIVLSFVVFFADATEAALLGGWGFLLAAGYMLTQQFVKQGIAYGQKTSALLFPFRDGAVRYS